MKKLIILAAIVSLAFAGVAAAQTATRPAGCHRGAMKGHVAKALNLTDQQKAQMKAIMQQARADAQKATTPEAKRDIYRKAWDKVKTDVLTQEQRDKLQTMHERAAERHAFRQLNLTPDQKAKVKEIMTAAKADAQKATTPEAKKAVWQAAREKVKTDVLTDAQRKQLEEMKAKREQAKPSVSPAPAPAPAPTK